MCGFPFFCNSNSLLITLKSLTNYSQQQGFHHSPQQSLCGFHLYFVVSFVFCEILQPPPDDELSSRGTTWMTSARPVPTIPIGAFRYERAKWARCEREYSVSHSSFKNTRAHTFAASPPPAASTLRDESDKNLFSRK